MQDSLEEKSRDGEKDTVNGVFRFWPLQNRTPTLQSEKRLEHLWWTFQETVGVYVRQITKQAVVVKDVRRLLQRDSSDSMNNNSCCSQ